MPTQCGSDADVAAKPHIAKMRKTSLSSLRHHFKQPFEFNSSAEPTIWGDGDVRNADPSSVPCDGSARERYRGVFTKQPMEPAGGATTCAGLAILAADDAAHARRAWPRREHGQGAGCG